MVRREGERPPVQAAALPACVIHDEQKPVPVRVRSVEHGEGGAVRADAARRAHRDEVARLEVPGAERAGEQRNRAGQRAAAEDVRWMPVTLGRPPPASLSTSEAWPDGETGRTSRSSGHGCESPARVRATLVALCLNPETEITLRWRLACPEAGMVMATVLSAVPELLAPSPPPPRGRVRSRHAGTRRAERMGSGGTVLSLRPAHTAPDHPAGSSCARTGSRGLAATGR